MIEFTSASAPKNPYASFWSFRDPHKTLENHDMRFWCDAGTRKGLLVIEEGAHSRGVGAGVSADEPLGVGGLRLGGGCIALRHVA